MAFKLHLLHSCSARDAIYVEVFEDRQEGSFFEKSWDCFRGLFRSLYELCGGLATVFPGTATVESDFSIVHWEKRRQHHVVDWQILASKE